MSVSTTNLSFNYDESRELSFPDIVLAKGQKLLILGKSGTGKTTLLHLLAGLLRPTKGEIALKGKDIQSLNSRSLDRFRGRNIGLIFQRSHFVKSLSIKDNLLLAQKLAGQKQDLGRVRAVLQQMGILEKLNSSPSNLSIGEQQRVSIARAILNEPSVLLADEPTSALDDENAQIVADLLEHTANSCGANLIVVTHDQRLKSRFKDVITL